jgi:hypothetical protein
MMAKTSTPIPSADNTSPTQSTGGQAGCAEHPKADGQGSLAAEPVAEASGRQDQGGEHQAVGVDHPLQVGGGGVQLAHQARQRHVDDGGVQADHKRRHAQRGKRQPSASRCGHGHPSGRIGVGEPLAEHRLGGILARAAVRHRAGVGHAHFLSCGQRLTTLSGGPSAGICQP